jgi:hypothetical protein
MNSWKVHTTLHASLYLEYIACGTLYSLDSYLFTPSWVGCMMMKTCSPSLAIPLELEIHLHLPIYIYI